LTKKGSGSVILTKVNSYTGSTLVQAGVLACTVSGALPGGAVDITTGAKLELDYSGTRQVSQLTFNGGAAQPNGTYGATGSGATTIDNTHFAGTGTVTVGPLAPPVPTLPVSGLVMSGGVPSFTFPTDAGYKYRMVYNSDVSAPLDSWLPVINAPNFPGPDGWSAVSSGANMTITDAGAAGQPERFYRLEAANP
jgi:autotransporter-associated beta strand protein